MAAADAPVVSPPSGWWVLGSLKQPKAAEGRIAWRFTPREIITVTKDNQIERRAADLKPSAGKPNSFATETPVSMLIEKNPEQGTVTVTVLKPKAAFFTLTPAGDADVKRFDDLVKNTYADTSKVDERCEQAARCCRISGGNAPECTPTGEGRTLTHCEEIMLAIRQTLAADRKPIPPFCR